MPLQFTVHSRGLIYQIQLVFVILLLSFSTLSAQSCQPAEGDPIKVGLVFPQGALISLRTSQYYEGAVAMIDAINACGGVDGQPVEAVYVAANNTHQAENAVEELSAQGVQVIIGSGIITVSQRLRELAEEKNIVFWEVTESLTDQSDWTFSTRPDNYQLGYQAAQFIESQEEDEIRAALVFENSLTGREVAEGVMDGLENEPVIEQGYEDYLPETYRLAQRIRDNEVNYVIVIAFDTDSDRLWYQMRDADAVISAWVHIGNEGYRQNLCQRFGNTEGMISISPSGHVRHDYRVETGSIIYERYTELYGKDLTEQGDLSASGVYMLLHHILPAVNGAYTAENIRDAILASDIPALSGLMGDGFLIDAESGGNERAVSIAQQRQDSGFCSLSPDGIATCSRVIQPFMTWRERAIIEEREMICTD